MIQYNWDRNTNLFTKDTQARLDELETKLQGKEVYLKPACSTFDPVPITGKGFACLRDEPSGEWVVVPDYRSVKLYSTETGHPIKIDRAGPRPDGVTDIPPPDFSRWDGEKWIPDDTDIKASRIRELKSQLNHTDVLKMVSAMFNVMKEKGLLSDSDFEDSVVSGLKNWESVLTEIDSTMEI